MKLGRVLTAYRSSRRSSHRKTLDGLHLQLVRNVEVDLGHADRSVSHQAPDRREVDVLGDEHGGERVPQGVRVEFLVEKLVSPLAGDVVELRLGQRIPLSA